MRLLKSPKTLKNKLICLKQPNLFNCKHLYKRDARSDYMNYKDLYEYWLKHPKIDATTKSELLSLQDKESEIQDRFYKNLEFGTAGLRGKLGVGSNRMNFYTIGRATQGIANYICMQGPDYMERGVAIAFDNRHFSKEFADYVADIFAANHIKSYLFESLRPTPELSYAIRTLKTASGINITASHNPKDYNGYKVYWDDGAQVLDSIADAMTDAINAVDIFEDVKSMNHHDALAQGYITLLGEAMDRSYLDMVKSLSIYDETIDKDITIVYTPLNGAGSIPVQRILKERGFNHIHVVPEQKDPDPNFTTIDYPNPEDTKAFTYAERLGKEVGATLLLATDPDCDRLAIEVMDKNGHYVPFNGNQTGAILIKYIVEGLFNTGKLPKNPAIVKSIVTGDLGKVIGESFGVTTFESLTGFKNICGRIPELAAKGYTYIFGYEESIGYTTGTQVRDKDAVSSTMLLCEAAAFYKAQGKTLLDVREELFKQYGYYVEKQISLVLEGIEGQQRIARMMESYRKQYLQTIGPMHLVTAIDYINGYQDIPASDVLKFRFDDGSWYALRPSGTEPKIKLYLYTKAASTEAAEENIQLMEQSILHELDKIR
jgi:phosphoglucomutase